MSLANNLDQAYRACDPDKPLAADDERYVDLSEVRGTRVLATKIARRISRCDKSQFHQQLITGHRGCGKSTELLRLKKELEESNFFVVYIDTEELLDLVDLDYLDVMLSIAKQTEQELRNQDIFISKDLLTEISDWFTDKVTETDETAEIIGAVKTEAEAGAKVPFFASLMASLTAEIKSASSRRTTTRQKLKREQAVFTARLNNLLLDARHKVQEKTHTDIVLIVDGLEKMHYEILSDGQSTHNRLFVQHAEQLKAPECHIIYTMPISLAYNANLGNDFDTPEVIPMVKTSPEGIARLHEVIGQRVNIESIVEDPEFIDELAMLSGGVMRDLIRLVRLATETDNEKIGREDIDEARKTLIREYDRLLRDVEIEQLKWVLKHRRVTGDEAFARMLYLRLILEYHNGERWANLHPAIMQISWVRERLEIYD